MSRKKAGGKDFQPGFDPRRNLSGGPKSDVRVNEIKLELKAKIAESLKKFYDMSVEDMVASAADSKMSVGERIALRFLAETARKGDPARINLLAEITGIKVNEVKHELSDSLASLLLGTEKNLIICK